MFKISNRHNTKCAEESAGLPGRGSSQGEEECEFEERNFDYRLSRLLVEGRNGGEERI